MAVTTDNGHSLPALTLDRTMPTSLFADARTRVYQYKYAVGLYVAHLVGGVPTDPKKMEGWLTTKVKDKDTIIRTMVAEAIVDRGLSSGNAEVDKEEVAKVAEGDITDEAVAQVVANKLLNGFKRLPDGMLYIEGRHVKAMIKENANIRWANERWGPTKKGTKGFFAEHVFVPEDVIPLGVYEPSDIQQRFVQGRYGSAITLEEYVAPAEIEFTLITDFDFPREQFEDLFVTAEMNGLGASRSQGYGRFAVTKFDKL